MLNLGRHVAVIVICLAVAPAEAHDTAEYAQNVC